MFIGNPTNEPQTIDLELTVPENEEGIPITTATEMQLFFDQTAWDIIKSKVETRSDINFKKEKVIVPIDRNIRISNLTFPANTRVPVYVGFSF